MLIAPVPVGANSLIPLFKYASTAAFPSKKALNSAKVVKSAPGSKPELLSCVVPAIAWSSVFQVLIDQ